MYKRLHSCNGSCWSSCSYVGLSSRNNPKCLTINIGTGIGTSVLEIINAFKSLGISIPHLFVERRFGDNPFVVADNKLALKLLNWSPKRKLIDMCKDSLNNVLFEL